MASATFTCSQCLHSEPIESGSQFCPRCGLPIDPAGAKPNAIRLKFADDLVTVRDRLAFGDLCNLYHCDVAAGKLRGVFKIARSHHGNRHVAREAETLNRLHAADLQKQVTPFLPRLAGSIQYRHLESNPPRLANILVYFDGIASPDELYTLEQVRTAYPNGIDDRDMAWMWRRLLTILGFVHAQHMAHGMVTPDHILIEPKEHKLILIGWSAAVPFGLLPHLSPLRWRDWSLDSHAEKPQPAGASRDLGSAAKSMSYLLGGRVEPAIARHLQRASEVSDASKLLAHFDKMIDALWGPRQFRSFAMPPL